MGWLKDYFKSRMDGKFQWYDLFHPLTSGINAITGNDRTEWIDDTWRTMGWDRMGALAQGKNYLTGDNDGSKGGEQDVGTKLEDTVKNAENHIKEKIEEGKEANGGSLIGAIIDDITNEGEPGQTQLDKDANELLNGATDKIEDGVEYITGNEIEINGSQNPEGSGIGTSNNNNTSNEIRDETMTNVESEINFMDWAEKMIAEQREREDTAYQRAVKDMQKAGINPNLMNVQPASSSAGSTSGMDGISAMLEELDIYLTNELKADEGQKDRLSSLFGSILMAILFKKVK